MGDGDGDGTVAWAVMHERMVARTREIRALAAERDALAQRVEALEGALRTMVDYDASMPEWAVKTAEHRAYSDGVNAAAGWYQQVARDALKGGK